MVVKSPAGSHHVFTHSTYAWIEATLDGGGEVPKPSSPECLRSNPDYAGWTIGMVAVDAALLDSTPERVNIILPRRVLRLLDAKTKANRASRSGFIAHLAPAAEWAGKEALVCWKNQLLHRRGKKNSDVREQKFLRRFLKKAASALI